MPKSASTKRTADLNGHGDLDLTPRPRTSVRPSDIPIPGDEGRPRLKKGTRKATHSKVSRIVEPTKGVSELARTKNLVERIQEDIEKVGVVGEWRNRLLIYLIMTSRKLPKPLAGVSRGVTGIGKSIVIDYVKRLFPDDVLREAMTATEASWFNHPPGHFKNTILLSGERKHATDDDTKDANRIIRQFLTEGRATRYKSFQQGENWVSDLQTMEGPIAYLETTTAGSIFEEDLNRMLQIYMDASERQTDRVKLVVAGNYALERPNVNVQEIIAAHHEFQEALEPCDIRIPYWKKLAELIPSDRVEVRRIIQQVLSTIEAIVFLHQFHREKQDGLLLATFDDYTLARELLAMSLQASLGDEHTFKEAEQLKTKIVLAEDDTFTKKQVAIALGKEPDNAGLEAAKRLLKKLMKPRLVKCARIARGQTPALYRWNDGLVLPTVEQLQPNLGNEGNA